MAIDVRLSSTWDAKGINQAVKDINSIKSQLGSIERRTKVASDSFNAFGGTIKKLGTTVAAVFGAQQIGQFFSASIKGAIEDEKSLRILNKTLENMGFRGAARQVDEFIGRLQYSAGVADDILRPALNNLVVATGNLSKSQQLLQVALDVSAGSGRDLDTITVALAKAFNGNFTALKKLNLGIDESLIKNKDLSGILDVLSQKFAGASANAVDTYAGKIQILKLAIGDAQESIGYGFLNSIERVTTALGKDTGGLANSIQDIGTEIALVVEGVGVLTAEVINAANDTEKSFKGLVATLFSDILRGALTVPKWIVDWLQGKATTAQALEGPQNATPAGTRLARQARENQKAIKEQTYVTEAAKKAQQELEKQQEQLKQNTIALTDVVKNYTNFVAGNNPQSIEGATNLAQTSLAKMQQMMANSPKINKTLVDSFKELASVVQQNFSYALDQAKTKLEAAKQQYNSFRDTIKSAITGVMDFTNIQEGSTFLDSLQEQSKKAQTFGAQIQQLLAMGLNESAITQIANAGFEVGSTIADEIIKGGSTVVDQVNTLTASVTSVADQVSTTLADQFYAAGVNAAQNLVDALIAQLNASAALISQAIANATAGQTTATDSKNTKKESKKSKKKKALGGMVFPNTSYLVGEKGPELFMPSTIGNIVPNNQLANKAGASINIVVNAGIGTNGTQVGKDIVEAIKKYERASGQVFASA